MGSSSSSLPWMMAGSIIMALVIVFIFQKLGFRFVVSAGVGR